MWNVDSKRVSRKILGDGVVSVCLDKEDIMNSNNHSHSHRAKWLCGESDRRF